MRLLLNFHVRNSCGTPLTGAPTQDSHQEGSTCGRFSPVRHNAPSINEHSLLQSQREIPAWNCVMKENSTRCFFCACMNVEYLKKNFSKNSIVQFHVVQGFTTLKTSFLEHLKMLIHPQKSLCLPYSLHLQEPILNRICYILQGT